MQRDVIQDQEVATRRRYVEGEVRSASRLRWRRGRSDVLTSDRRPRVSAALHQLGNASAHAAAGLIAVVAVVGWVVLGAVIGFPDWWETAMYVTSSGVTLVMVFAIQHTQSRQQLATQRKLDEVVRSLPGADNRLIATESAPDEELQALGQLNATDRQSAVRDQRSPPPVE
jgi:low affinity Fe/Cu permease